VYSGVGGERKEGRKEKRGRKYEERHNKRKTIGNQMK